jgi:hypothetical protein
MKILGRSISVIVFFFTSIAFTLFGASIGIAATSGSTLGAAAFSIIWLAGFLFGLIFTRYDED